LPGAGIQTRREKNLPAESRIGGGRGKLHKDPMDKGLKRDRKGNKVMKKTNTQGKPCDEPTNTAVGTITVKKTKGSTASAKSDFNRQGPVTQSGGPRRNWAKKDKTKGLGSSFQHGEWGGFRGKNTHKKQIQRGTGMVKSGLTIR